MKKSINDEEFLNDYYYNTAIFNSYREEILKLFLLLREHDKPTIHVDYLLEKVGGILNDYPIILHPLLAKKLQKILKDEARKD